MLLTAQTWTTEEAKEYEPIQRLWRPLPFVNGHKRKETCDAYLRQVYCRTIYLREAGREEEIKPEQNANFRTSTDCGVILMRPRKKACGHFDDMKAWDQFVEKASGAFAATIQGASVESEPCLHTDSNDSSLMVSEHDPSSN